MRLFSQKMMGIHAEIYVQNCSYMNEMSKKYFVLTMLKMIEKKYHFHVFLYINFSQDVCGRKIKPCWYFTCGKNENITLTKADFCGRSNIFLSQHFLLRGQNLRKYELLIQFNLLVKLTRNFGAAGCNNNNNGNLTQLQQSLKQA